MGDHFLLQKIFQNQGSSLGVPDCILESCRALWEQGLPAQGRKEGRTEEQDPRLSREAETPLQPLDLRKPPGPASKNRRGGGEGLGPQGPTSGGSQSALLPGGEHRPPAASRGPAEQAWSLSGPVPEPTTHCGQGAQEVACSSTPNPPHQLKEPLVWDGLLLPRPLCGGEGHTWTLTSQG